MRVKNHCKARSPAWALISCFQRGPLTPLSRNWDSRYCDRVAKSRLGISSTSICRCLAILKMPRFQEKENLERSETVCC